MNAKGVERPYLLAPGKERYPHFFGQSRFAVLSITDWPNQTETSAIGLHHEMITDITFKKNEMITDRNPH
jgi:hypothetical protein